MRKVPISSIADVTAGQGAPKPDEFSDSGIPFVRAGSLEDLLAGKSESDLELVPAETAKKRKLKLYPSGSILFAKSGMSATKDRIYVLQNPAYVVSHLAILTSKDNVHRDYLRLALKQFPPSSLIKDPAYPAIGLGEIQGYEIPVPDEIDDQKRIAHLLGKLEGLIARRKQHLQQLDDLLKSVFLEMFGDPVRNEKGWDTDSLSTYGSFKNGLNFKKGERGASVRYLGVGDFKEKSKLDSIDELSFIELNQLPAPDYFLKDEDLLFVRSNGNRELVGRCMAVYPGAQKVVYSGFIIRYRIDSQELQSTYIAHLFRSSAFRQKLFQGGQGANIQNINQQSLSGLDIPIPPKDLQNQFAAIIKKVDALKSRYQQSLTDLESLYGALSQKAFKGELDLSRVVLPVEGPEVAEEETTDIEEKQPMEPLFELPAPAELALLQTAEGRKSLLGDWLNAWQAQLGDAPFAAQAFMDAARQRLWELAEDEAPDWGAAEYDELKTWVFEALEQGRLTQGYDDANNRVQITAAKG